MHLKILSQWLAERLLIGHSTRAAALLRVVGALLAGGKLSLTHLGRSLNGPAYAKHQIKAVDRLLGNRHLHRERDGIYRAIVQTLLLGNKRPVIVVDWADFELGRQWLMLKAAVPVGGRAISLYERVFPFKRYNSPGARREFLRALHAVLPADCRPIIVTDPGFRGPWFRDVESYGWDWIGRIRNKSSPSASCSSSLLGAPHGPPRRCGIQASKPPLRGRLSHARSRPSRLSLSSPSPPGRSCTPSTPINQLVWPGALQRASAQGTSSSSRSPGKQTSTRQPSFTLEAAVSAPLTVAPRSASFVRRGEGIPQNFGQAAVDYRRACDGHDGPGCNDLGSLYRLPRHDTCERAVVRRMFWRIGVVITSIGAAAQAQSTGSFPLSTAGAAGTRSSPSPAAARGTVDPGVAATPSVVKPTAAAAQRTLPSRAPVAPQAQQVAPAPRTHIMPEQTVWYGWQTLTTDAAALSLVIVGGAVDDPLLLGASFATYVLGGPIVHATHGNWGRATLSLGARVGVPLLGIATGVALEDCSGGDFCGLRGALIGGIVGLAGAVAIDSAALAREKKPVGAALIPSLRVSENETWLGVSGQF